MSGRIRSATALAKTRLKALMDEAPALQEVPQDSTVVAIVRHYDNFLSAGALALRKLKTSLENVKEGHRKWLEIVLRNPESAEEKKAYDTMLEEPEGVTAVIHAAEDVIAELETNLEIARRQLERANTMGLPAAPAATPMYTTPPPAVTNIHLPLPPLQLPSFSGDVRAWPTFWSAFEQGIDCRSIPDIQKLTYRLGLLKDGAKTAVEGYLVTPANYAVIKEVLRERYSRPEAVRNLLSEELQRIPKADNKTLSKTVDSVERLLRQMEALQEDISHPMIQLLVEKKLPLHVLTQVHQSKAKQPSWNMVNLRQMLKELVACHDSAAAVGKENPRYGAGQHEPATGSGGRREAQSQPKKEETTSAFVSMTGKIPYEHASGKKKGQGSQTRRGPAPGKQKAPVCVFCQGPHSQGKCDKYVTVPARESRAREMKLCFKCLRTGHRARSCTARIKPCFRCNGDHQTAFCKAPQEEQPRGTSATHVATEEEVDQQEELISAMSVVPCSGHEEEVLLMCIEAEVFNLAQPEKRRKVLVFFDTGSHRSYIDEALVGSLRVKTTLPAKELLVTSFGEPTPKRHTIHPVEVGVVLKNGDTRVLNVSTIPFITHKLLTAKVPRQTNYRYPVYKARVDDATLKQPRILVGADQCFEFLQRVKRGRSGFYEIITSLGTLISGKGFIRKPGGTSQATEATSLCCVATEKDVDEFWKLETIGITDDPREDDDEIAASIFEATVNRNNGRYSICWPWKQPQPALSDNLGLCMGRLRSLWSKLKETPELLNRYHETVQEQLQLGVIEVVSRKDSEGQIHYLPHLPIVTPGKTTTKLRIVYDASAHARGNSLNQALYRGPVLLQELCGILLRWRQHRYAMIADLEKAFLQIEIAEKDRDVTRFFWLRNPEEPPGPQNLITYRFKRLPFGLVCSPYLLAAVLEKHLKEFGTSHAEDLLKNTYVDNIVISTSNEDAMSDCYRAWKEIYSSAKMNVRQFATNCSEARQMIQKADRDDRLEVTVLGIRWRVDTDEILVVTQQWKDVPATKRTVLSHIASHFDPLGLISPALVAQKKFCQELFEKKMKWDVVLERTDQDRWLNLNSQPVTTFRWARQSLPDGELQLHVFVDASSTAYAAAVYGRVAVGDRREVALLYAKSRLMPVKPLTIPRAELLAALIGAKAIRYVQKQLGSDGQGVCAWSDSKCVLYWLRNPESYKLERFVYNRVRTIHELDVQFRYVPTEDNPADIGSRGTTAAELRVADIWWRGPEWLRNSSDTWPEDVEGTVLQEAAKAIEEVPENALLANTTKETEALAEAIKRKEAATSGPFIDASRYSHWSKLWGVAARMLQYLRKSDKKPRQLWRNLPRTASRFQAFQLAEKCLIRQAQQQISVPDIQRLKLKCGDDEIWRVHGRLGNLPAPQPIFLLRSGDITNYWS